MLVVPIQESVSYVWLSPGSEQLFDFDLLKHGDCTE